MVTSDQTDSVGFTQKQTLTNFDGGRLLPPKADTQSIQRNALNTAAYGCGFNWWMQHLNSNYREGDVENEVSIEE